MFGKNNKDVVKVLERIEFQISRLANVLETNNRGLKHDSFKIDVIARAVEDNHNYLEQLFAPTEPKKAELSKFPELKKIPQSYFDDAYRKIASSRANIIESAEKRLGKISFKEKKDYMSNAVYCLGMYSYYRDYLAGGKNLEQTSKFMGRDAKKAYERLAQKPLAKDELPIVNISTLEARAYAYTKASWHIVDSRHRNLNPAYSSRRLRTMIAIGEEMLREKGYYAEKSDLPKVQQ